MARQRQVVRNMYPALALRIVHQVKKTDIKHERLLVNNFHVADKIRMLGVEEVVTLIRDNYRQNLKNRRALACDPDISQMARGVNIWHPIELFYFQSIGDVYREEQEVVWVTRRVYAIFEDG